MKEPIVYAAMESAGPWYAPIIKAHSMLGRRASGEGLMSSADVAAQIETKLPDHLPVNGTGQAPTRQMAAMWEKKVPDYPEKVMAAGLIRQEDLLPWALAQLKYKGKPASSTTTGRKGHRKDRSGTTRSRRKAGTRSKTRGNPVTPAFVLLPGYMTHDMG